MEPTLKQRESRVTALAQAAELEARFGRLEPEAILEASLDRFGDSLGAVSSFGADSAVLLHMVARLDPNLPVVFLDTGQHFGETLQYRDQLVDDLGLTNLRIISPKADALASQDPHNDLYKVSTDACCDIRKVEPMARAVAPFRAWFTGRKRHQASTRSVLPSFEAVGERVRINPLAGFTTADQAAYMRGSSPVATCVQGKQPIDR